MGDKEKIQADIIIEILGRPAEHIKKALEELIKRLGSEKGVKIIVSKVHEPKLVENSKDLYTSFAEVSLEFDSLANYFGTMFSYMPANIEITSPQKFVLSNIELNELGNRLLLSLHNYDAITKKFIYENNLLTKKLMEVAPHLFKKEEKVAEKPETKTKKEKKSKKSD